MALVKDYGVKILTNPTFQVDFSIPDNCNFGVTLGGKIYTITIQLNPGCNKPSAIYMPCTTTVNALDDTLDIYFAQVLNGVTTTKPKVRVADC